MFLQTTVLSVLFPLKQKTNTVIVISIIAQVIIEMRALWLVDYYVISCYNHPTRGEYNTEALILKMATARFFYVFEEEN